MNHIRISSAIVISFFLAVSPLSLLAQSPNPVVNYEQIIADEELLAYQTMNQVDIQLFLESKQSYLSTYSVIVDTGERLTAAELIYRAAQNHRVNPKFLIVLLQKEQSLIEDLNPTQNQLDWAAGYGCLDNQPCNERWRGFHKQINSAAEQFRYYYDAIDEYNFRPGKTSLIDGQQITPKNRVTAALYNYTPHLHGNELFRKIWDRYFLTLYPDGILLQATGDPGVWLIQNGVKRAFTSRLALVTRYNPDMVVPVAQSKLDTYTRGLDIAFPAYSLVRSTVTKNIYLLTTDKKRLFSSMEVFRSLGFNPEEIDDVDESSLATLPDGRPVTLDDAYPTGAVLQDIKTGSLFYVEAGRKYALLGKEILKINFPKSSVSKVTTATLDKYPSGFPVQVREGTLVKGSGSDVYVISNQMKRHIASEKVFNTIGYKWKSIVIVSDDVLDLHPTGDPIIVN